MHLRVLVFCTAFYIASTTCMAADSNGLHAIDGIPLYIDGAQSGTAQLTLSPALLEQAKSVSTLGDALRILGPAYIAPDDRLRFTHWRFQNGFKLTLWPQGGEALNDTIVIFPRADCGVSASVCKDLMMARYKQQIVQNLHDLLVATYLLDGSRER